MREFISGLVVLAAIAWAASAAQQARFAKATRSFPDIRSTPPEVTMAKVRADVRAYKAKASTLPSEYAELFRAIRPATAPMTRQQLAHQVLVEGGFKTEFVAGLREGFREKNPLWTQAALALMLTKAEARVDQLVIDLSDELAGTLSESDWAVVLTTIRTKGPDSMPEDPALVIRLKEAWPVWEASVLRLSEKLGADVGQEVANELQ